MRAPDLEPGVRRSGNLGVQERVRTQLREEKSNRRTLDTLRREYYVSVRL